ncbi:MAG: hypothetical protein JNK14_11720 [Chitinophagaceae bacterium]|nr:hypothetical protein [Chitinophagaceae bacterium]
MKKTTGITSIESKVGFQEMLLEKFMQQNLPPIPPKQSKLSGMTGFTEQYKEVEYCAAETPVTGTVEIFYIPENKKGLRRMSVPVASRFIVFCIHNNEHDYKVSWSCSLS